MSTIANSQFIERLFISDDIYTDIKAYLNRKCTTPVRQVELAQGLYDTMFAALVEYNDDRYKNSVLTDAMSIIQDEYGIKQAFQKKEPTPSDEVWSRAITAGYVTSDKMPTGKLKTNVEKVLLAYCIGVGLGLTKREIEERFTSEWGLKNMANNLSYITEGKSKSNSRKIRDARICNVFGFKNEEELDQTL